MRRSLLLVFFFVASVGGSKQSQNSIDVSPPVVDGKLSQGHVLVKIPKGLSKSGEPKHFPTLYMSDDGKFAGVGKDDLGMGDGKHVKNK